MKRVLIAFALAQASPAAAAQEPGLVESGPPAVYVCKLANGNEINGGAAFQRHDFAVLVRMFDSPKPAGSYSLEISDPDNLMIGAPLVHFSPRNLGDKINGPLFLFSSNGWPNSGQALGLKSKKPRYFDPFGTGQTEMFDAALFEKSTPNKF